MPVTLSETDDEPVFKIMYYPLENTAVLNGDQPLTYAYISGTSLMSVVEQWMEFAAHETRSSWSMNAEGIPDLAYLREGDELIVRTVHRGTGKKMTQVVKAMVRFSMKHYGEQGYTSLVPERCETVFYNGHTIKKVDGELYQTSYSRGSNVAVA